MTRPLIALAVALSIAPVCASERNPRIEPTPEELRCETSDDCTVANLACATCGDVVSKRHAQRLAEQAARLCRDYRGPVAECAAPRAVVCVDHHCAFGSRAAQPE